MFREKEIERVSVCLERKRKSVCVFRGKEIERGCVFREKDMERVSVCLETKR